MEKKSKFIIVIIIFLVAGCGALYYEMSKDKNKTKIPELSSVTENTNTSEINTTASNTGATNTTVDKNISNNKKNMNTITLETSMGKIVFQTYNEDAPKTVENFITLSKKGFYDGLIFHRVIDGFMIQGGDPTGTGRGGPGYAFADELNPNTSSYKAGYQKGVVAMANSGPNTNGSQFFIMLENNQLPNLYTIFGKVIRGQDVVDAIGKVATDRSDKPLTSVTIEKVIVE